jgi:hypothetical protein
VFVLLAFVWAGTGYVFTAVVDGPLVVAGNVPSDDRGLTQAVARSRGKEQQLQARLKATRPRGVFVVIDQTHNRLYLKKDSKGSVPQARAWS